MKFMRVVTTKPYCNGQMLNMEPKNFWGSNNAQHRENFGDLTYT